MAELMDFVFSSSHISNFFGRLKLAVSDGGTRNYNRPIAPFMSWNYYGGFDCRQDRFHGLGKVETYRSAPA